MKDCGYRSPLFRLQAFKCRTKSHIETKSALVCKCATHI